MAEEEQPGRATTAPAGNRNRHHGAALIAIGLSPFALGGLFAALGSSLPVDGACLLREHLGLPCPFCGSTRAFGAAVTGDASFLHYNFFWVALALGAAGTGVLALCGRISLEGFWSRSDSLAVRLTVGALLAGWVTALLNSPSILV